MLGGWPGGQVTEVGWSVEGHGMQGEVAGILEREGGKADHQGLVGRYQHFGFYFE